MRCLFIYISTLITYKEFFYCICSFTSISDKDLKVNNKEDDDKMQNEEILMTIEENFKDCLNISKKNGDICSNKIHKKDEICCEDKNFICLEKQNDVVNALEETKFTETDNNKNFNEKWNFEVFYLKTLQCIHQDTNGKFCEKDIKLLLGYIWEYVSNDKTELAVFLSNALHNTSYFTVFKTIHDDSLYASRGLLQIQGKENYETLTKISNTDYFNSPDLLAILSESAIKDTGLFWKYLMKEKKMTWENSMDVLKIENWTIYCKSQSKGEYPSDVSARYDIYKFLTRIYN